MAEHLHNVVDDDLHFKIDPSTRRVYRTSEDPIVLVQHDHNSERISFEIPREIDGHDMTQCDKVRIHFLNFDAANPEAKFAGVYESTDLLPIAGDDDNLLFTWLVHMDSTGYAGPLSFAVSFVCTDTKTNPDGTTTIVTTYSWNTLPNTEDIGVSDGMNHAQDLQDDYYDVIDYWINTINNRGDLMMADITAHADKTKKSVEASIGEAGELAKQDMREYATELKDAMGKFSLSEMGLINQTTGTSKATVMSQDATTKAIEAAKASANSEIAEVESSVNKRCADTEELLSQASTYKRLTKDDNGYYKLEPNKLYHICHYDDGQSTTGWRMSLRCLVKNWSIQKSNNTTANIDSVEHLLELPEYRDRTPDIYGFQIRVIDDGKLKYRTDTTVAATVSYEIIRGHDVDTFTNTYKVANYELESSIQGYVLLEGTETYTINGLYATIAGAVYEISEQPPSVNFTINANGISDIYKTETNGLVDTYTIVLDDGTTKTFTVTNGTIGHDGMSAYDIAINNGFVGTEKDWLNSLKDNVIPDYDENNKYSKSYIKNRPFYDYRSVISEDPVSVWDKSSNLFNGGLGYTYNNSTSSTISLDNYAVFIDFYDSATGTKKTEQRFLSEFRSAELEDQCGVLLTYNGPESYCNAYVVIVNDYNAFAIKYNSDVSANGIYLGYYTEDIQVSGVLGTASSKINALYTYKGYFKKLDNKFLDLKNNDDFKALERKVGSGGGAGSGGNANVFVGTWAEYYAANAAGEIPEGMVILITDEDDAGTVAILGQAILGEMLLG